MLKRPWWAGAQPNLVQSPRALPRSVPPHSPRLHTDGRREKLDGRLRGQLSQLACVCACVCVCVCARARASKCGPRRLSRLPGDPARLHISALLITSRPPSRACAHPGHRPRPPPPFFHPLPHPRWRRLFLSTLPPRVTLGTRGRDLCLILAAIQREGKNKGTKGNPKAISFKPLLL